MMYSFLKLRWSNHGQELFIDYLLYALHCIKSITNGSLSIDLSMTELFISRGSGLYEVLRVTQQVVGRCSYRTPRLSPGSSVCSCRHQVQWIHIQRLSAVGYCLTCRFPFVSQHTLWLGVLQELWQGHECVHRHWLIMSHCLFYVLVVEPGPGAPGIYDTGHFPYTVCPLFGLGSSRWRIERWAIPESENNKERGWKTTSDRHGSVSSPQPQDIQVSSEWVFTWLTVAF